MENKTCTDCKIILPLSSFSTRIDRKKLEYQSKCKDCHQIYRRKHYQDNKQKYIQKASEYKKELLNWFREYKKTLSCANCNDSRSWVLDFHHIESETKEGLVSELVHRGSKNRLVKEIEKCIVLCANCHRDLHYQEKL